MGTRLLHEDLLNSHEIVDYKSYRDFQDSLSDGLKSRVEKQAHALAGYLLIPSHLLKEELSKLLNGSRIGVLTDIKAEEYIKRLASVFEVSETAMYIQVGHAIPDLYERANSHGFAPDEWYYATQTLD